MRYVVVITFLLQALLASSYSQGNYEQARLIIYRVLQVTHCCHRKLFPSFMSSFNYIGTSTDPEFFSHPTLFYAQQIGLGSGITLSMILFFGFGSFSSLFSTDSEVLNVAQSGILVRNHNSSQKGTLIAIL